MNTFGIWIILINDGVIWVQLGHIKLTLLILSEAILIVIMVHTFREILSIYLIRLINLYTLVYLIELPLENILILVLFLQYLQWFSLDINWLQTLVLIFGVIEKVVGFVIRQLVCLSWFLSDRWPSIKRFASIVGCQVIPFIRVLSYYYLANLFKLRCSARIFLLLFMHFVNIHFRISLRVHIWLVVNFVTIVNILWLIPVRGLFDFKNVWTVGAVSQLFYFWIENPCFCHLYSRNWVSQLPLRFREGTGPRLTRYFMWFLRT